MGRIALDRERAAEDGEPVLETAEPGAVGERATRPAGRGR